MLKWIATVIFVLVIVVFTLGYFYLKGPDLSKYEYLKDPQLVRIPNQKMLVVEAKGDPNVVGKQAFGLLYQTYFKLKNSSRSLNIAPRARWPLALDTPKEQWIGRFALPVSRTAQLPENFQSPAGFKVELKEWDYGETAEILHIGPYGDEAPTVNRLLAFIKKKGYAIVGEHEEEYLKGPGMFGPGDPKKYFTIIRYRIKK